MATQEQIDKIFTHFITTQPMELYKLFNDVNSGIGAVLKILSLSSSPVPAGKISEMMSVSEARVTVLLKKMKKKDFIVTLSDKNDARVTLVRLTDNGKRYAEDLRDNLRANIATIIDEIGSERLEEYTLLNESIHNAIKKLPPPPKLD